MQKTKRTHKEKSKNVHRSMVERLETIDFNGVGISKPLIMSILVDRIINNNRMKERDKDDYRKKFPRSFSPALCCY